MTPALRLIYMRRHQHAVERRRRFERLAHHEAAHAIIAVYYDRQVEGLQLGFDDSGTESGDCFAEIRTLPTFSQLVVLAAGSAAERILTRDEMFTGADDAKALEIVSAAFRDISEAATELQVARREAERLVGDNWQAVAALASALIEAGGQMTRDQVEPFLRDVPRAAPPRPAPLAPPPQRSAKSAKSAPPDDLHIRNAGLTPWAREVWRGDRLRGHIVERAGAWETYRAGGEFVGRFDDRIAAANAIG